MLSISLSTRDYLKYPRQFMQTTIAPIVDKFHLLAGCPHNPVTTGLTRFKRGNESGLPT